MDEEFTGSFYFNMTINGNLIGEFSNNKSIIIQTENANRTSQERQTYVGTYVSSWVDSELNKSKLEIIDYKFKFKLNWTETGNQDYYGEGFLIENILIGYYKKTTQSV